MKPSEHLKTFIEGPLKDHAGLVHAGVPSHQASAIVFTNENDQMNLRIANERSACCNAPVNSELLNTFCSYCGNWCITA